MIKQKETTTNTTGKNQNLLIISKSSEKSEFNGILLYKKPFDISSLTRTSIQPCYIFESDKYYFQINNSS